MTIDQAKHILSDAAYHGSLTYHQDYKDALKLGIAALKAVQLHRQHPDKIYIATLPGETPEEA